MRPRSRPRDLWRLRPLLVLLWIAGLCLGCGLRSRLDESGNAVVGGRVYRHGDDYGPVGEQTFRRVLSEELAGLNAGGIRPAFVAELPAFGKLYCSVKGGQSRDFGQAAAEASNRFREISPAPAASSEEVLVIDITAKLADDMFCPSGYPNPALSSP